MLLNFKSQNQIEMKKVCLLIAGMLFLTLNSIAQDKMDSCQQNDCCQSLLTKSVVTKGYYAIGDNAKKLNNSGQIACCNNYKFMDVTQQPKASKGYYAIAPRQESLPQRQPGFVHTDRSPKIVKGFYAIGNNQQKLYKGRSNLNGNCSCDCR